MHREPGPIAANSVRGFSPAALRLSLAIDRHSVMQLGNGFAPGALTEKREDCVQCAAKRAAEHSEAESHRSKEMLAIGLAHGSRVFSELAANRHLLSSGESQYYRQETGKHCCFL